jgi:hypothetical protein
MMSLRQPGGAPGGLFGTSVAISGGTIAVGAAGARHDNGLVYIYQREGTRWKLSAVLTDPVGDIGGAEFGAAIAASSTSSGPEVLIGAPRWRGYGSAFLFTRGSPGWRAKFQFADPARKPNDQFGYSVALRGSTFLIGAPGTNGSSGQVYS